MITSPLDQSQRNGARNAGFMFLFLMGIAVYAQSFIRGSLIADDSAAQTAINILGAERLFRLGIVLNLVEAASGIILVIALYVLLKRVNPTLALLAAFWRLGEAVILGVITIASLTALRLLDGADYLQPMAKDQAQVWARLLLAAEGSGYNIGLIFFALGSTVFSYLMYRSHFIPKFFGLLGTFGSLLVVACLLGVIVLPEYSAAVQAWCFAPIAIFEVSVGFWLLIRGVGPRLQA